MYAIDFKTKSWDNVGVEVARQVLEDAGIKTCEVEYDMVLLVLPTGWKIIINGGDTLVDYYIQAPMEAEDDTPGEMCCGLKRVL